MEEKGETKGPLHGLPISMKVRVLHQNRTFANGMLMLSQDAFNIKGIATTIGFVSFIDHGPATENGPLIDLLLELGAVLYVKTNLSQTMGVSFL